MSTIVQKEYEVERKKKAKREKRVTTLEEKKIMR